MNDQEAHLDPIEEPAISEQLARKLDNHRGRWVAVDGNEIIAIAESAADVARLASERGTADPIVFRVPLHPERLNIL